MDTISLLEPSRINMYRLAILACIVVAAQCHMMGNNMAGMNMNNMHNMNNVMPNMNNMAWNMNNNNNNQAIMQMMQQMMMNNMGGNNMGNNAGGNPGGQNSMMNMLVTTLMGQLLNGGQMNNNNNNQGYSSNEMRQMERMMQQKMMMEMAEMMMHYMDFNTKQAEFEKAMEYLCIAVNATYFQSELSGKQLFNSTTEESAEKMFNEAEESTMEERFMAMADLFDTNEDMFGEMFLRIATWACESGDAYMKAYHKMEMLEKKQESEQCGDHDKKKK